MSNRPRTVDEALEMWGAERPEIFPEVVPYYEHEASHHPDAIRVSFGDGSTAIYDLRVEQPAPVILENIRIIRRMKAGYPPRRRRER